MVAASLFLFPFLLKFNLSILQGPLPEVSVCIKKKKNKNSKTVAREYKISLCILVVQRIPFYLILQIYKPIYFYTFYL